MNVSTDITTISDIARRYLRFQLMPDIGPIRLRHLLDHFGSLDAVMGASRQELQRVEGIGPRLAETVSQSRQDDAVEREIEQACGQGVRIICAEDDDYPAPLRNIPDPPICLYVRGRLEPADAVAVAIVGTRRCSHYGREQALRFGEALAGAGFTVVSGLARGIDSHAHRGALQAGGRTVAVLGNGLASVYPLEHAALASDIVNHGALLSESPLDGPPTPENFPRRNRIIAGMSLGVIVIEAGKRSGALITARLATEYNREVFAVPGRVDQPDMTAGTNALIRDGGAKLITCMDDVLDELSAVGEIMRRKAQAPKTPAGSTDALDSPPSLFTEAQQVGKATGHGGTASESVASAGRTLLAAEEQAILTALAEGEAEADRLCASIPMDTGRVMTVLTSLELKGLVTRLPGNRFARRTRTPKSASAKGT